MASNVLKECAVCHDEYDEDERCPRLLPCSHTFCTECILELIRRKENCPNCREIFNGRAARDFKVNTAALDLLRYIKEKETEEASTVKSSPKGRLNTRSKMLMEMKSESQEISNQNIESCRKMEQKMQAFLKLNRAMKRRILDRQKMVREKIISKLETLEKACKETVNFLNLESKILEAQLTEVGERINHLEVAQNNLESAKTLHAVDEVVLEMEEINTSLNVRIEELHKFTSREDKVLEEIQKNVMDMDEKVDIIKDILESLQMEEKLLNHHYEVLIRDHSKGIKLNSITLKTLDARTKALLKSGRTFSIHQFKNQRTIGRISLEGDNIKVHCLRNQDLPPNSYTIEHKDVMSLVDPSSRRAFLEFGTDQATLGTVLIDLTPHSKRAENFFVLCSGQVGPSYLETVIHEVGWKGDAGEQISCGDYEYNNGRGGEEVIVGAGKEEGGVFQKPWLEGTVCRYGSGDRIASKFNIVTKDWPNETSPAVFGKVVSGLNVIKDAISRYLNIRIVKIKDCGILLPL